MNSTDDGESTGLRFYSPTTQRKQQKEPYNIQQIMQILKQRFYLIDQQPPPGWPVGITQLYQSFVQYNGQPNLTTQEHIITLATRLLQEDFSAEQKTEFPLHLNQIINAFNQDGATSTQAPTSR